MRGDALSFSCGYGIPSAGHARSNVHSVHFSLIKLFLITIFLVGFGGVFASASLSSWLHATPEHPLRADFWLLASLAPLLLGAFVIGFLPQWMSMGEPALVISDEGLRFRGKTLMPWTEITENTWRSVTYLGFFETGGTLSVRAGRRKVKIDAFTLRCSPDEYMRLCDRYDGV